MNAHRQSGFTLLEMLVATLIFVVGFMAVYGLFLGGMKFRSEADAITRSAVAASNIVAEMRLGIIPIEEGEFLSYRDQPGLFYRIESSETIESEDDDDNNKIENPARVISLQFVYLGIPAEEVTVKEVRRRFRRAGDPPQGPPLEELLERQVVMAYPAVIYPHNL